MSKGLTEAATGRLVEIARQYGVSGEAPEEAEVKAPSVFYLPTSVRDRILEELGIDYLIAADNVGYYHQLAKKKPSAFRDYRYLAAHAKYIWEDMPGGKERYSPMRARAGFHKAESSKSKWAQALLEEKWWMIRYGPNYSLFSKILSEEGLDVKASDGTLLTFIISEGLPPPTDNPALAAANVELQRIPIVGIPYSLMKRVQSELGPEYLPTLKKVALYSAIDKIRYDDIFSHKPERYSIPNHGNVAREVQCNLPGYDHPLSYMKPKGAPRPARFTRMTPDQSTPHEKELAKWHQITDRWEGLRKLLKEFKIRTDPLEHHSSVITRKRA